MANRMLYRWGETNPVRVAVDSAQVIEIGDLLWLNTDDARPASQNTYYASLSQTQANFHDKFLGVAEQQSRSGDTDTIRVATTGVFEFDCAAATFEIGDLVGPDDNAGATALLDQQVILTGHAGCAVGRVAKRYTSNTTSVEVDIVSYTMYGGPQPGASST